MKLRIALFASAISLCVAAQAVAEPPLGSRLGDRVIKKPQEPESDAAIGAQEMARCLVDRQRTTVQSYLATIDEKESDRISRKMSGEQQCFNMTEGNDLVDGRMITFPHDIYRGMLSEWMIRSDEVKFQTLAPLARQLAYSRDWYAISGRDNSVNEMATCVSEVAPQETLALLRTVPYSAEEGAAFGGLGPHLGACLRAGVKVTGNRQSLRAALADALYQRVINPPAIPVGPTSSASK